MCKRPVAGLNAVWVGWGLPTTPPPSLGFGGREGDSNPNPLPPASASVGVGGGDTNLPPPPLPLNLREGESPAIFLCCGLGA